MTALISSEVERFCHRLRRTRGDETARVASAPGVVDVMGGLGESAGSLVVAATLRASVCVAVERRRDQRLEIRPSAGGNGQSGGTVELPMHTVLGDRAAAFSQLKGATAANHGEEAAAILGLLHALQGAGLGSELSGGLTIEYETTAHASRLTGTPAALAAATLEAVAAAALESPERQAHLIHCLEQVAALPHPRFNGLRMLLAAALGQPRSLLQLRRQPAPALANIELPPGLALAAVECFPARPIRAERAAESQVAARIGHRIIVELMRQDGAKGDPTGGYLTNVRPAEFVERYRRRIPMKISGKGFQEKFPGGWPAEAEAPVDPAVIYKPRSRAEHHIYENQRVHDFGACLVRARRTGDDGALTEAGELMYASHWSHSQRCGLGSVETDSFAQLVRQRGPAHGFFGVKLAGGWSDGLMIVLMRDSESTRAMLEDVADQAARRFGSPFRILSGSDPGAAIAGATALESGAAAAR